MSNSIKWLVLVVLVFVLWGGVRGIQQANREDKIAESNAVATENTFKNAFMSGCTGEGATESQCACTYKELKEMYPDLTTDNARLERINTYGFNRTETDAVIKACVTQPEVLTN